MVFIGSIYVYIQTRDMFLHEIWNSQHQFLPADWFPAYLTLHPGEFRLVFVARRGYNIYSALGLDNVTLTQGACTIHSCKYTITIMYSVGNNLGCRHSRRF